MLPPEPSVLRYFSVLDLATNASGLNTVDASVASDSGQVPTLFGSVFAGDTLDDLVREYTQSTGRMAVLPDWIGGGGAIVGYEGGTQPVRDLWMKLRSAEVCTLHDDVQRLLGIVAQSLIANKCLHSSVACGRYLSPPSGCKIGVAFGRTASGNECGGTGKLTGSGILGAGKGESNHVRPVRHRMELITDFVLQMGALAS
jgi:hypothetical protein